jgi:hypothetical protein
MYDKDGQEVQKSIFENQTWTNLTFDFSDPAEYFSPNLDNEVSRNIISIGKDGGATGFETREIVFSGEASIEVSIYEDFEDPISFEGMYVEADRITNISIFDAESGTPIFFEMKIRSSDGQERTLRSVSVISIEKVDTPPNSILSLFEEVSK